MINNNKTNVKNLFSYFKTVPKQTSPIKNENLDEPDEVSFFLLLQLYKVFFSKCVLVKL